MSTTPLDAFRFVLAVRREAKPEEGQLPDPASWLTLTREKCNDAPAPVLPIRYRLHLGRLQPEDSLDRAVARSAEAKHDDLIVEAVRRFTANKKNVGRWQDSTTNLAALLRKYPDVHPAASKLPRKNVLDGVERLLREEKRLESYVGRKDYVYLRVITEAN